MFSLPINAISWTVGGLSMYMFAYRSLISYRTGNNPVARMYFWMVLSFGTGFFFFGVPAFFTLDSHKLIYTYFMADLFVQIGMQMQVWLLWFIGLRKYLPLNRMLLATALLSLAIMAFEITSSGVTVSQSPLLIIYADKPIVLILKTIIYLIVALPLGYFFLKQVPGQSTLKGRIKSLMTGFMFIFVAIGASSNNLFSHGSDTVQSSLVNLTGFIIFFLIHALPKSRRRP